MRLDIQARTARCPKCSSMMVQRVQGSDVFYICPDCKAIWQVQEHGQADIEVTISDYRRKEDECDKQTEGV